MNPPTVVERKGKSLEEIRENAAREFQVPEERVHVEMLEEAKDGFLGFGSAPAAARVTVLPDRREAAREFLGEILAVINPEASVETLEEEDRYILSIEGPDVGNIIGKRGQTLTALQYLVNVVANRWKGGDRLTVEVDVAGYRECRNESLRELSERLAEKVLKSRKAIELEPMSAQERRIVHMSLKEWERIATRSEGEEPYRRVIIACSDAGEAPQAMEEGERKRRRRRRPRRRSENRDE